MELTELALLSKWQALGHIFAAAGSLPLLRSTPVKVESQGSAYMRPVLCSSSPTLNAYRIPILSAEAAGIPAFLK